MGIPGITAHRAVHVGGDVAGRTVVVQGAGDAVGMCAVALARHSGARVIGIAGGKGKIRQLVDDLGFDVGIDRSAPDFALQLRDACPEGINVYFDNVQGELLDAAFENMNNFGRIGEF